MPGQLPDHRRHGHRHLLLRGLSPAHQGTLHPARRDPPHPLRQRRGRAGRNVSTRVASTAPIVAERPIYFNYRGAWTGGSDVIGARRVRPTLISPRVTPAPVSRSGCAWPTSATDATVTVTYYYEDSAPLTKDPFTLSAGTRRTLYVNAEAGAGRNVSTRVASTGPHRGRAPHLLQLPRRLDRRLRRHRRPFGLDRRLFRRRLHRRRLRGVAVPGQLRGHRRHGHRHLLLRGLSPAHQGTLHPARRALAAPSTSTPRPGRAATSQPGWPPPPPSWPSAPSTSTTAAPGPAAPTSSATDRRLLTGARHRRRRRHMTLPGRIKYHSSLVSNAN